MRLIASRRYVAGRVMTSPGVPGGQEQSPPNLSPTFERFSRRQTRGYYLALTPQQSMHCLRVC